MAGRKLTLIDDNGQFAGFDSGCIRFIGIDVEIKRKIGRNAGNDVIERQRALAGRSDLQHLLVLNAPFLGVGRMEVDMAGGNDHAFLNGHFTCRANDSDARSALNIARFANRGLNAERKSIRAGHFQLSCFSRRSKNSDFIEFPFRTEYCERFLCSELSRLGKIFHYMQFVSGAEQDLDMLLGHVDVTGRNTNRNLFHDNSSTFQF